MLLDYSPLRRPLRAIIPLLITMAGCAPATNTNTLMPVSDTQQSLAQGAKPGLAVPSDQQSTPPNEKSPMVPLVLELFTSEGCSSCPPADLLLGELLKKQADSGPDLIGLAYHVDYWNRLGWPDRFSDEKYTRLQRQYGRWLKDPQIYTPELVVQGVAGVVGSNRKAVASAMQQEPAAAPHYQLQLQVTQVAGAAQIEYSITPPPGDPSTAIVRTMLVQSQASTRVERGENGGRTLRHVNIVRGMEIGPAAATGTASLSIPEKESGTFSVVCILQNANTGHIQAALQQEIP